MNSRIREVNGIKVLRRYGAGSIFSGLICLAIVASTILMLLIPWLTVSKDAVVADIGVLDFIKDFFEKPSDSMIAVKDIFAIADIGGIIYLAVNIVMIVSWLISAILSLIILFLGLEFLFRGKVTHYKLAFRLSLGTIGCYAAIAVASILSKIFVTVKCDGANINFTPSLVFLGTTIVFSVLLGVIHHTCFKDKVFIGDLGDLTSETVENNVQEAGPSYTTREVVKVRYEPSIGLPSKLSSIGGHAFSQNENLQIAMIPNGIKELGQAAFSNCPKLQIVSIPTSVKSIGYNCFFNCTALKRINYAGCKEQWRHIKRGSNWLTNAGTCTVVCCDGAIIVNPYH